MTRDQGQVNSRQAVVGALVLAATVTLVVAGAHALVRPAAQLPELEAPVGPGDELDCARQEETIAADQPTSATAAALIECPDLYDGRRVTYEGEVVRAVLRRGDRAWVQLNDDPYALRLGPLPQHRTTVGGNSGIPVSIPAEAADQIRRVGDYSTHGDLLRVVGVFRRADPLDGGGPAIRADTVDLTRRGRRIAHPVATERVVLTILAVAMAVATTTVAWKARRR